MSQVSFITFCVENYAQETGLPSDQVYRLFKKEKLLDLLLRDYEDLHGMSTAYMLQFCQKYLQKGH